MQTKTVFLEDLYEKKFCDLVVWLSTRSTERRKEIERRSRDLLKDEGKDVQGMLNLIFTTADKLASYESSK